MQPEKRGTLEVAHFFGQPLYVLPWGAGALGGQAPRLRNYSISTIVSLEYHSTVVVLDIDIGLECDTIPISKKSADKLVDTISIFYTRYIEAFVHYRHTKHGDASCQQGSTFDISICPKFDMIQYWLRDGWSIGLSFSLVPQNHFFRGGEIVYSTRHSFRPDQTS